MHSCNIVGELREFVKRSTRESHIMSRLLIRNIGFLLRGDLGNPILDADTVLAVDGKIAAVGKQKDIDAEGATLGIDATGTTPAPGLISSPLHPLAVDLTPTLHHSRCVAS